MKYHSQAKWREANPVAVWAQSSLRSAIRRGIITPPETCENCNTATKLDAHHPDYSRPAHVQWLCRPCHKAEHQKGGDA